MNTLTYPMFASSVAKSFGIVSKISFEIYGAVLTALEGLKIINLGYY